MATLAARISGSNPAWRSVTRAIGQTGGAALLSGLLGLLAMKIIAVMLGPAQVAVLSTLQQLRQTGLNAATLTGQTALIRNASALDGRLRREFIRTTLLLLTATTLTAAATFCVFPEWIASETGLAGVPAGAVRWIGFAVVLSSGFVFLTGLLNARGAIADLALLQLAAPAAMVLLAYPVSWGVGRGQSGLLAGLLAASSAVSLLAAARVLTQSWNSFQDWVQGPGKWWSSTSCRGFLAIAGSMFASGLVSSTVFLVVRAQILKSDGLSTGGQFDAAWAISMNQAGLMLASLQTYYLPQLARTADTQQRREKIGHVLTIAALAAALLIGALTVCKPVVIRLLYSEAFAESASYLRWTLIGDYLKVTSWILSIPLVAAANMSAFLTADLLAWGSFAAVTALLAPRFGPAEGAAIAFAVMYAVHLIFCAILLRANQELPLDRRTVTCWTAGLACVLLSSALSWSIV